jgi:nucleoside-diphosphate kinase
VERTLIIIKPDAVQRGLAGEIIKRFEQRGLRIIGMKLVQIDEALAKKHYAEHEGKPFFAGLVSYITASPVIVMALEGSNAVAAARNTIGATKPHEAAAGTIRGDFALDVGRNLVHGSDGVDAGTREIDLFFSSGGLVEEWERDTDTWIFDKS